MDRLNKNLEAVSTQIKEAEQKKAALEQDLANLQSRQQELMVDKEHVQREKAFLEEEKRRKELEVNAGRAFAKLIKNVRTSLADPSFAESGEIERICNRESSLHGIFSSFSSAETWKRFSGPEDIPEEELQELKKCVATRNTSIAGETQASACDRLKRVVRDSLHPPKPELVSEVGPGGKPIQRVRFRATNLTCSHVHQQVRELVEAHISAGCNGLRFDEGGLLHCDVSGVESIEELLPRLKVLIHEELRLQHRNLTSFPDQHPMTQAKFDDAVAAINSLKLPYKDVVGRCVDEIEVVCCNFVFDKSASYPGVHLTINAEDAQCLEGAEVDGSGRSGGSFVHKTAAHGADLRRGAEPEGRPGSDGCHGRDGRHGGHVAIKVTNPIKDFQFLKITSNGGDAGEAQLGGNGDQGKKGRDGKDGKAADTCKDGSGQTCVSFGKEGSVGGPGGSPGRTGWPGRPGLAGKVLVEQAGNSQAWSGRDGVSAGCVLQKATVPPAGGEGGEPGLYGLDHVKDKENLWKKQTEEFTALDRDRMRETIKDKYKEHVADGSDIKSTNHHCWWAFAGLIGGLFGGGAALATASTSQADRIDLHRAGNQSAYRDRDRNKAHRRGKKNDQDAHVRQDDRGEREPQDEQRNIDSLEVALKEQLEEAKDINGDKEHELALEENMKEISEAEAEIETREQHEAQIQAEEETVQARMQQRQAELEQTQQLLNTLQQQAGLAA